MDLIECFLDLSIRRGSTLSSLQKNCADLECVLKVFASTCSDPSVPSVAEAEQFLSSAGSWINATPQELILKIKNISTGCDLPKVVLEDLCDKLEHRRQEIRYLRRSRALEMEKKTAMDRIDTTSDDDFMRCAIQEAQSAMKAGEVPVGAVIVDENGRIIGRGHNRVIMDRDPTAHAEIVAIRDAAKKIGNYRLENCRLFVTLEPCPMCSGAIMNARLARLIYGAADPRAGCVQSVNSLFDQKNLNTHTTVTSGILAEDCLSLLREFFEKLRRKKGAKNE